MRIRSVHRTTGVRAALTGMAVATALMIVLALGMFTAGCGTSASGAGAGPSVVNVRVTGMTSSRMFG